MNLWPAWATVTAAVLKKQTLLAPSGKPYPLRGLGGVGWGKVKGMGGGEEVGNWDWYIN